MAPERTCVACRTRRPVGELVRAGRSGGAWYLGPGPGRGAWWCATGACVTRVRASGLARALRTSVSEGDLVALVALAEGPPHGGGVEE